MKTSPFYAGLCLAAAAAVSGCATTPHAVMKVSMNAGGATPVQLTAPLIVADERLIALEGPELTAEARAKFREERAARITQRSRTEPPRPNEQQVAGTCIQLGIAIPVVGLAICPFALLGAMATMEAVHGVANGVRYVGASLTEPSLRLSSDEAERIAAPVRAEATSAALVERAMYIAPAQFADVTRAESLLVVRLKAAEVCEAENAAAENVAAICLVAEAQAFLGDGLALAPSEHRFVYGPLTLLTAGSEHHLDLAIDLAMESLAESIVAAYTGTGPGITVSGAAAHGLPAAGDNWTYRLTEPQSGATLHRVAIDEYSAGSIEQRGAATYLVREGALELFSPHLIAFDPSLSGLPTANIEANVPSCAGWMCTLKARVVGTETVRVPAGEFDTLKVEVEHAWMWSAPKAYPSGARTLTIWYSPKAKRAVKFSSRGTRGAHFKTEFDLELEGYRLNQEAE